MHTSDALTTQQYRAESWLKAAKAYNADVDIKYISLWIAFCACINMPEGQQSRLGERSAFQAYVARLVRHDDGSLSRSVWESYPNTIRGLLDNPFVWGPFWQAQADGFDWKDAFDRERKRASRYFKEKNSAALITMVFDRLATLRNQMLFGGATYQSRVNRSQVHDAAELLEALVPIILTIMQETPDEDWGSVHYPVIQSQESEA